MSLMEIKLIIAAILLLGIASTSSYLTHKLDNDRYDRLVLSYQQAKTEAVEIALKRQQELDAQTQKAAQEAALHQVEISNSLRKKLNAVHKSVHNNCLSWGSIQLLDSYALSTDPSRLSLPSGKFTSSPSGFTADQLVASVLNNYGIFKSNRQTLIDLQDFYKNVK